MYVQGNHRPSDQDIPSFRVDHVNVHNRCKGADNRYFDGYFQGHNLHGGGLGNSGSLGGGGSQFYRYQDGHFFNGLTVVTYELKDTVSSAAAVWFPSQLDCMGFVMKDCSQAQHANGGGFCCVPGSHNGHLKLPEEWGDMSSPINIDAEWLYKVPASAGDAVIFTEALTHGAIPWTQEDSSRRTLFYKYSPHGTSWSSQYYNEEDYYQYEDMDDRKFAILKVSFYVSRSQRMVLHFTSTIVLDLSGLCHSMHIWYIYRY